MSDWWDRLDDITKERHAKEFKRWINAIIYGIKMVRENKWSDLKRKKYILKIAEEIRLPYKDIQELQQEINMMED